MCPDVRNVAHKGVPPAVVAGRDVADPDGEAVVALEAAVATQEKAQGDDDEALGKVDLQGRICPHRLQKI